MKVIKHGMIFNAKREIQCNRCNCVFNFNYKDIGYSIMDERNYVCCPECNCNVYLDNIVAFKIKDKKL